MIYRRRISKTLVNVNQGKASSSATIETKEGSRIHSEARVFAVQSIKASKKNVHSEEKRLNFLIKITKFFLLDLSALLLPDVLRFLRSYSFGPNSTASVLSL